ncbi:MAG: DUF91 domain-containing protein [Candidatus Cloacimonadia bacterium]
MNTHVLIVDKNTLKYHLEHQFFGTGAKEYNIDFNSQGSSKLTGNQEGLLVSMIADGERVRKGDLIIFYLQQSLSGNILEGKFYGVFRTIDDGIFLDNFTADQYLYKKLGKSLTFRGLIEPYEVFPEGVTEWEALDEIKSIQSPCQMLWSLIYRKLKGNRGNTMITIYEADKLINLIKAKNRNTSLKTQGMLTFNETAQIIEVVKDKSTKYCGKQEKINILPRLINKQISKKAFEVHLQAYITQNIGKRVNSTLDNSILTGGYSVTWIGNEVSCGVGMQRIDIAVEEERKDIAYDRIINAIELKCKPCDSSNLRQINRYISWLEQYYLPNRPCAIQPVLLGPEQDVQSKRYIDLVTAFKEFNDSVNPMVRAIKYIEFTIVSDNLVFRVVDY